MPAVINTFREFIYNYNNSVATDYHYSLRQNPSGQLGGIDKTHKHFYCVNFFATLMTVLQFCLCECCCYTFVHRSVAINCSMLLALLGIVLALLTLTLYVYMYYYLGPTCTCTCTSQIIATELHLWPGVVYAFTVTQEP